MKIGDPLVAKEKLALSAFVLGLDSGQIELGHRNIDRMVQDSLGSAPRPISRVWLDSAWEKLGVATYSALAIRAKELSKQGALNLKPQTDNREELRKALTDRARMARGQAPIKTNYAAEIERNRKLQEF